MMYNKLFMAQNNILLKIQQKNNNFKADDEFYTPYNLIEKCIEKIKPFLKNKIIYLNCDDPNKSNFIKYFINNQDNVKYKKLLYNYIQQPIKQDMFKQYQNGDFRSEEAIDKLKEADIVITNPPFSLVRDFYTLLKKYDKKFCIIVPLLFPSYLCVKEDFLSKKIKILKINKDKHITYYRPDGTTKRITSYFITNLDIQQEIYSYKFIKSLKEVNCCFYDNRKDILRIDNGEPVPYDYNGLFTLSTGRLYNFYYNDFDLIDFTRKYNLCLNGKKVFTQLLCKRKS